VQGLWPHIRAGAAGGLGGGLVVLVLDLLTHTASEGGARLSAAVTATVLPGFFAGGVVLAVLLCLLRAAARGLTRLWWAERDRTVAALLAGVASAPPFYLLVHRLAAGRQAAQIIGPAWIQLGLTVLLAALAGLTLWLGLRVGSRAARSRPAALAVGVVLLLAAVALFFADAYLYRRLYLYLHNVLLLGYLACGTLSVLSLGAALRPGRRLAGWTRPVAVVLLLALAVGATWWSRRALAGDQRLRFAALEQTTAAANILSLVPLDVPSEAPLFLDTDPLGRAHGRSRHTVRDANVVLVTIDALRADHLGVYGYRRPTSPNIDALASRAVRFESAYCQAPLTCYSVPSLLTGDYLRSTLPLVSRTPPTVARILQSRGYTTAAFYNASIFFCDDKKATSYGDRKFQFSYAETALRPAPELTERVLRYLERFRDSGRRKLLLWVHYFDVHEPYMRRKDPDFGPRAMDRYDSEIAYVDRAVGRLVASLHQLPGPTIFVLTSDHGEEFKEHGGNYHGSTLYEEQIRVPLIIGVPGVKPGVVRTPSQLVDVVPTLLDLLGVRVPESVRGESLVPELLGKGEPDRTAFSEVHTKKMVRFRHWKLIHDYRRSTFQLYDLLSDPRERVNLIGQRPRDANRLKQKLHGWFDRLRRLSGDREENRPEGIDLGRIGDRRSVPLLARLLEDPAAESRWRQEAAQLLGQLQDHRAAEPLWAVVADDDERVAAEAAVALGEIKQKAARMVLPDVVARTTDAELRMRAAIALARVASPLATPALIEALYGDNWEIQNRAAHYLGFVGDSRAIGPLLRVSRSTHLRSRVALSLGRVGARHRDPRVLKFLLDRVKNDPHAEVRQKALGGIGFLGDRRAVRPLSRLLASDPDLTWTPETLSRLGGVGWYWVPGVDFSPRRTGLREGWGRCSKNPSRSVDDYLGSTQCVMAGTRAAVQFRLRRHPFPAQLMVRFRPLHAGLKGRSLTLTVNGRRLPKVKLGSSWRAVRVNTKSWLWRKGQNTVTLRLPRVSGVRKAQELMAFDYMILAERRRKGAAKRPHP
jgi:arylsulfatase A-like enzyme